MANNIPSNNALLLTQPDFFSIRGSLKNYLQSQSQFNDYNFEGSSLSVVLDLLSYNTYQNAFLTNMVASELFIDTAQLPSSIISRAKELGYTPRSSRSAISYINIQIYPNDNPGSIIVPAGTLFTSSIGNQSFSFSTDEAYVINSSNNQYIINNVPLYEGFSIQDVFTITSNAQNQFYDLSNANVDTTSISVFITENGPEVEYTYTNSIVGLTATSNVYFIQQDFNGLYQISFGDGVTGYSPGINALVRVPYIVSSGIAPNGANTFVNASTIGGYSNVIITTSSSASGGDIEEDIESVRYYAPRLNQTRGRAFTDDDYKVILKNTFPEIKAINSFGGQLVNPPQYGTVLISISLANSTGVPQINQQKYFNFIKTINPTLINPVFIDPQYFYLNVNTTVYYDYTLTSLSQTDIEAEVLQTILDYNSAELEDFDITFRFSNLTTLIDASDNSINSDDTTVLLSIPLNTSALANTSWTINFANQLSTDDCISSTNFKFNNTVCQFADDGLGNLLINTTSTTGVTSKVEVAGTINYLTGTITIFPITFQQIFGSTIKLFAKTLSKDITATMNTILAVDQSNIIINVVPQKR